MLQHELVRVATTDREPSAKPRSVTLRRGEGSADQEKQQSAQLVSAGPRRPSWLRWSREQSSSPGPASG